MRTRTLGALLAAALIAPAALAGQQPTGTTSVPQSHTVVKGETLWGLAQQFLGDPFKWPDIYELNKASVANPHWIYPGQVFKLPGTVTSVGVTVVTPPAGPPPTDTAAKAVAVTEPARVTTAVAEPVENTSTGRTVFQRESPPPRPEESRGERSAPPPTVLPGEYFAAPYVVSATTIPGAGRIMQSGDVNPRGQIDSRTIFKAYDDVLVDPPAGAAGAKGERYMALRLGPSIPGVGQVMIPVGVLKVTRARTGTDAVMTQVVNLYGELRPNQILVAMDSAAPSSTVRPSPVADGQETEVKWVLSDPVLPTVNSYVVLGLTAADGVKPGDEFVLFRAGQPGASLADPATPEIPLGRAKAVRVTPFGTTAIVTAQEQPAINVGVLARLSAKMP
ncbi:MAG TPA: LysM peptidoglycan-binding domain-containing protein [Gemmatimonadaceae bacterium]|nr:LysM peptidoglycan-binding domain-containing protein [Gemmatimonadaceae bacterium]